MAATTSFSVRMDVELKKQADLFLSNVGMNMSTAINLYLRKMVREQRIPFDISLPVLSEESRSALEEAKELRKPGVGQEFRSVKALKKDLLS